MSSIAIKWTEKCIVNKLRSVVIINFVTTFTPAWRSVITQQNSKFKTFNHGTTLARFNSKFEVLEQ